MSSEGVKEPQYCGYTEYVDGEPVPDLPATGEGSEGLERAVWDALYSVDDPEMPISIVDLGLIYGLDVSRDGAVIVEMTLTYTGCPAREMLQDDIREAVSAVKGVTDVDLQLVWSPPWSVEMVTEQGRQNLRDFGLSI